MALPAFVLQLFVLRRDNNCVLWQCAAVKLPNADKAVVERDKISEYLLNPYIVTEQQRNGSSRHLAFEPIAGKF